MNYWEEKEAALLKKENAYLEKLNFLEKIVDNNMLFPVFLLVVCLLGFNIGFLIGLAL